MISFLTQFDHKIRHWNCFFQKVTSALRPNVLIVEDEQMTRQALAALMIASGYQAQATGSAEEALSVLESGSHPDIALVDLDLPGMNGLDFIGRLARYEPTAVPVLITAANSEQLAQILRQRGVVYMRKPLDFSRLLTILGERQPGPVKLA